MFSRCRVGPGAVALVVVTVFAAAAVWVPCGAVRANAGLALVSVSARVGPRVDGVVALVVATVFAAAVWVPSGGATPGRDGWHVPDC